MVVMVDGNAAETIDGFANYNMTMQDEVSVIQSDGTNWNRLDSNAQIPLASGTTLNRYHGSAVTAGTVTTITPTTGVLSAYPMVVNTSIVIDRIATGITGTAGVPSTNTCRMGIYRDNGNVYPGSLVTGSDVATFDQSIAVKTNTFASTIKLTKGLYWLAYTCGNLSTTTSPIFRAIPTSSIPPVLGFIDTLSSAGTGYTIASFSTGATATALPGTFPSGATIIALAPVEIVVRITG